MGRTKQITEDALLTAAMRVLVRDGLPKLTLEATAKEAGVSKGGVLYSFPTKDELLQAMLRRCVANMDKDIDDHRQRDRQPTGRWMRGYLEAALSPSKVPAEFGGDLKELHSALLAAIAMNRELLSSVRDVVERWQHQARHDGIDPAEHMITMLAIDGLTFNQLLGSGPPASVTKSIVARLKQRTLPTSKQSRKSK